MPSKKLFLTEDERNKIINDYLNYIEVRDIAKEYKVHPSTITKFIRSCGIDKRSKLTRIKTELTHKNLELINGCLLSDSSLRRQNRTERNNIKETAHFISAGISKEYILFIKNNLPFKFSFYIHKSTTSYIKKRQQTITSKEAYFIRSNCDRTLDSLYDKWYPESNNFKKLVPRDLVLTPTTLLHWYIGDGQKSTMKSGIRIHTNSFSIEDVEFLQELLRKEGLVFNVYLKYDSVYDKKYPILTTYKYKYKLDFFNYIGEPIIDFYKYKWDLSHHPQYKASDLNYVL